MFRVTRLTFVTSLSLLVHVVFLYDLPIALFCALVVKPARLNHAYSNSHCFTILQSCSVCVSDSLLPLMYPAVYHFPVVSTVASLPCLPKSYVPSAPRHFRVDVLSWFLGGYLRADTGPRRRCPLQAGAACRQSRCTGLRTTTRPIPYGS